MRSRVEPRSTRDSLTAERLAQRLHVAFRLIPGDDETRLAAALCPGVVELEASLAQRAAARHAEPEKYLVGLHRVQQRCTGGPSDARSQCIGARGIALPEAILDVG